MTCFFCGEDSGGQFTGHISRVAEQTGIVPYCGECEPFTPDTVAIVHPDDFEALTNELREEKKAT